ncbi:putative basic proline-rich protein-like [Iris pallida]|uniref:Basic proline-rich protein-like n=1 Tax=Iris pallida TaxID=29817 RepID=A0AAX6IIC5_IRIPA|nr:putative basic proline-rich protein-like [Iris pallida]
MAGGRPTQGAPSPAGRPPPPVSWLGRISSGCPPVGRTPAVLGWWLPDVWRVLPLPLSSKAPPPPRRSRHSRVRRPRPSPAPPPPLPLAGAPVAAQLPPRPRRPLPVAALRAAGCSRRGPSLVLPPGAPPSSGRGRPPGSPVLRAPSVSLPPPDARFPPSFSAASAAGSFWQDPSPAGGSGSPLRSRRPRPAGLPLSLEEEAFRQRCSGVSG